jgi:hypothetical protein
MWVYKSMNSKLLLFTWILLIGTINISCHDEDDPRPIGSLSPIVDAELPGVGSVGKEINFMVSHAVFNGCGYYSSQETTQSGRILTITFYAQYHEGLCTMDIPIRKTNYSFIPKMAGTYTFNFNSGEQGYLVKTIQIE